MRQFAARSAVVDLPMPGGSGLVRVARLRALAAAARVVVLTGCSSIATAVEASGREQRDPSVEPARRPRRE